MTYCFQSSPPSFRYNANESSRSVQFRPLHHQGSASFTICKCKDLSLLVVMSPYRDSPDIISFDPTSFLQLISVDTMLGSRPSQPLAGKVQSDL